jgi:hypothetical protein
MIQIAADNQSVSDLTNWALSERFNNSLEDRVPGQPDLPTNIAFIGYST